MICNSDKVTMQENKNGSVHPALLHCLCSRYKTASRCALKSKTWWDAGGHDRKENRKGKTVL